MSNISNIGSGRVQQTQRARGSRPSSGIQSPGRPSAYSAFRAAAGENMDPVRRRLPQERNPIVRWARSNPQIAWVAKNITAPVLNNTAKNAQDVAAPASSWLGRNLGRPVADTLKSWGLA